MAKPTITEALAENQRWAEHSAGLQAQIDATLVEQTQAREKGRFKERLTAIAADASIWLTLLVSLSYDLGPLSTILPPEAKVVVTNIGLGAAFLLMAGKRWMEIRSGKPVPTTPAV